MQMTQACIFQIKKMFFTEFVMDIPQSRHKDEYNCTDMLYTCYMYLNHYDLFQIQQKLLILGDLKEMKSKFFLISFFIRGFIRASVI